MEFQELAGYLIALLWLLGPLLRRRNPQPAPGPDAPPPVVSPARLLGRVAQELESLEAEARRLRDALEPAVAARLATHVDEGLIPELASTRERLAALSRGGALAALVEAVESAQRGLPARRDAVAALRALAERRADPALAPLHAAADRLVAEVYEPLAEAMFRESGGPAVGAPIAVVWESRADDPLARAPFARALLPVPRAARFQPWLWPALGQSLGRYLQAAVPGLRPELYAALELDVPEPPAGAESPELARLLFGAWSATLLADVIGALVFGPAYLQMLVRAFGGDEPSSSTSIALGRGGELRPEPPPHVRVHLVGHWVAQMGEESTALELVGAWDAALDHPDRLPLRGAGASGAIPAGPLFANLEPLVDRLDVHPFTCLGRAELGAVPGLTGWSGLAGRARLAARALASGTPMAASPRALMAGATAAAAAAPQQAALVDAALQASLAGETAAAEAPVASSREGRRPRRVSTRRLEEALLLGDLLLVPRSRTPRRRIAARRPPAG